MAPDDTLLVQSGKPVGVVRTHEGAPRVLIANSLLVPRWATPEHFRELEDAGLMMYGQMTAGSWIYIGTQGILQGTYATFTEVANQHFGGTLAGTITLTGGLGGMGGAQPLAVTGNGGAALCIEVDPWRAQRRLEHGYLDEIADSLDDGIARVEAAKRDRRALSVAVVANCADVLPELVARGWAPDVVTDQTSAHDALQRLRAARHVAGGGARAAGGQARRSTSSGRASRWPCTAGRWSTSSGPARSSSTTATGCAARPRTWVSRTRSPTRASCWPTSGRCSPAAPDRSAGPACPARPADLAATDEAVLKAFPDDDQLQRWVRFAAAKVRARGCRRGSAGSATASGTWPGRRSTTW